MGYLFQKHGDIGFVPLGQNAVEKMAYPLVMTNIAMV
jgi:hypothetical protein